MRSTTSSHRRLHAPAPARPRLRSLAELVDAMAAEEPGHLLVHVLDEPGPEVALATKAFDTTVHPFDLLAGFTAPMEWAVFGLRVHGTARHLADPRRSPERTSTTFLMDRRGGAVSLMRTGHTVTELPGRAEGTLPDLCRRVLELPTSPPPAPSTRMLWITIWLDRMMAAWSDPARRPAISTDWEQVAILHPAFGAPPDHQPAAIHDPSELVALATAHTKAWPWARLRAEPAAVVLPDGDLPADIAAWMDDGFYARWVLGAFPPPEDLADDLLSLLGDPLRSQLRSTLVKLLRVPIGERARR